jgi:hypothetical protein
MLAAQTKDSCDSWGMTSLLFSCSALEGCSLGRRSHPPASGMRVGVGQLQLRRLRGRLVVVVHDIAAVQLFLPWRSVIAESLPFPGIRYESWNHAAVSTPAARTAGNCEA